MSRAHPAAAAVGLSLAIALGCAFWPASEPEPAPWERPPPPIAEGPVVPAERLHRRVFDNGLEVLVLEDHRLPRFEAGVVVRRGAGLEARKEAGLATYVSELFERGAGELDALGFARAVERLGASLSAQANWDATTVSISGLSEDRERLFELLVDVVRRPRFDAPEAEKARAEQLAALERAKDKPQTLAAWNLLHALYPEHRYGLPLEGAPEAVARFDAAAARDFHAKTFVASNAVAYFVGDLTAEDAFAMVEARLADWPAGRLPPPGPPPPERTPEARRVVIVEQPDLVQAQIVIGHEGIERTHPERVAAGTLNSVLGGSAFLSRLMRSVRAEAGLTYSVGSGFSMRRHPGPFSVGTFTRVAETRRVVDLLLAELERMQREPPDDEELRTAKSYMAGRFALSLETPSSIANQLVDLEIYGLPPDSLDTYRTRLRRVSEADVARVAREYLHPERAAIVVVGPSQELRPQLEDLGPVEVVEP